jgi:transposase
MAAKLTDEQNKKILDLYVEKRLSIEKVSDATGHSKNAINRLIKKHGVSRTKNKFEKEEEERICKDYLDDKPASTLAEKYGCDLKTILNIVNRYGIESRPRGNSEKELTEENRKIIQEMWEGNKARYEITQKLQVGGATLNRWLVEMELTIENRYCTKEDHPMWKGGKIINGQGYIMIGLDISDPYYEMANQMGYVLEHRYVMAKHLGMILPKNYTIHHIDGNIENNNLHNLELRKGPHLPGKVCCCGDCGSKKIESLPIQRTDYSQKRNIKLPKKSKMFTPEIEKEIVDLFDTGDHSISEIAKRYNTKSKTIKHILLRYNVNLTKNEVILDEEQIKTLEEMWRNNDSKKAITELLEISETTLFKFVNELNLPIRPVRKINQRNKKVKREKDNYISILLSETDEFYNVSNCGRMAEHRYVMAKHLGRPLTTDEKVHHIDGNTKNNNIENLQLVIKHHGKGQRYKCSDCGSINIIDIPFGE